MHRELLPNRRFGLDTFRLHDWVPSWSGLTPGNYSGALLPKPRKISCLDLARGGNRHMLQTFGRGRDLRLANQFEACGCWTLPPDLLRPRFDLLQRTARTRTEREINIWLE